MCKLTFRVLIRTSFVAWSFCSSFSTFVYINRFSVQSSLSIFAQTYSSKYKGTYFILQNKYLSLQLWRWDDCALSITYLKSAFNCDKISTFLQHKHIGFSAVFRIDGQFHILFRVASSDSNTGFGIMSQVSKEIAMSFSRHMCLRIWIMSLQDQRILMAIREDNINFRDMIYRSGAMFVWIITGLIKTISNLDFGCSRLMWDSILSWLMWDSIA